LQLLLLKNNESNPPNRRNFAQSGHPAWQVWQPLFSLIDESADDRFEYADDSGDEWTFTGSRVPSPEVKSRILTGSRDSIKMTNRVTPSYSYQAELWQH
jgi:hypothetical protein